MAIVAILNVSALVALTHDKYLRYQALNDPLTPNSYWIYERIHFDPTPIDVAFIGSSRTGLSIHSRLLEEDLAHNGIAAKAVNFYCFRSGVNMQFVIAKELLTNRKVKLIVLEMTEREERKGHDSFFQYADPGDVLSAPIFFNFNYLSDLARLPGRQIDLAFQSEMQQWDLRKPEFVPPPYEGPNLDHAEIIQGLDKVKHYRANSHTQAQMSAMRAQELRELTPRLLPRSLSNLEFRFPRYYENQILELARANGTKVVFLYVPQYGGPRNPPPYDYYANRADLINPWQVLQGYSLWADENHLNWEGSKRMTDYVAKALANRGDLK